ncbi:MAG: SRPBCC family protein [Dehalococcoidia bacterium]
MKHAAKLAALLGLAFVAYLRFGRPRVLDWNATEDERRRTLPGDGIVAHPAIETTRAITIEAPPERVWPWLLQMGPRPRAGVYTYDWIERRLGIDIENSDRLLPEFQHLEADTYWELSPGQGLRVRDVQPGRAIVLQWEPAGSTWAFVLIPRGGEDGGTRLISRNRVEGHGLRFWLLMRLLMEPGSLVMERKMLLGIRGRAERTTPEDIAALAR